MPMSIAVLERQRTFHKGRITHHEDRVLSIEVAMAAVVCPYKRGQRIMVEKTIWKGVVGGEAKITEEWFIDYVEYQSYTKPQYAMYGRKIKKNGEPTSFRAREIRGDVLRVVSSG